MTSLTKIKQRYIVGKAWPLKGRVITQMQEDILFLLKEVSALDKSIKQYKNYAEDYKSRLANLLVQRRDFVEMMRSYLNIKQDT